MSTVVEISILHRNLAITAICVPRINPRNLWFHTPCTLPIFQESDYPLEAASTWLIIILYAEIHIEGIILFISYISIYLMEKK
jgi:hypothetical protein